MRSVCSRSRLLRRAAGAPPGRFRRKERGVDERLTMDGPVACVIRVQGALAAPAGLGGLRVVPGAGAGAAATTELRGDLRGQAAVLGAVATLRALGFPLLRLDCAPGAVAPA